jgi:uncharacterized membrane protein
VTSGTGGRRVDAFSDGVFAIAMTLLVVELPFEHVAPGRLGHALVDHWAGFAAYAVSFLTIGIAWMHHHAVFSQIRNIDRPLAVLNLLLLMSIAFLPFTTDLLGDYIDEPDDAVVATVVFAGSWTFATIWMTAIWTYACRHELLDPDVSERGAERLQRYLRATVVAYAVFTLVALVSPIACLALFSVAAVFFLWRSDHRALEREVVE